MSYDNLKEIYDEFTSEAEKLRVETSNLDNVIQKPFAQLYGLLKIDALDFDTASAFHKYQDYVNDEFNKNVHSNGLHVHDEWNHWSVLPFGVRELPYDYDGELRTLVDILTNGEFRFEDIDGYGVYSDIGEYLEEVEYVEQEMIDGFKRRLDVIEHIRNVELPKINKLCDELREQFSASALLEDCKKYISR